MATGMEYMLKSLGLDPVKLQEMAGQVGETVKQIGDRLDRIETKLDRLLATQEKEIEHGEEIND